ncbi:hypothetical protein ACEWY4_013469 [Coilia grayii]|uniref:MBD domain-containing protein n=1 Tax=Coilia grayii TaxID=363190 RepID=A0ABD1JWG7_9TELE
MEKEVFSTASPEAGAERALEDHAGDHPHTHEQHGEQAAPHTHEQASPLVHDQAIPHTDEQAPLELPDDLNDPDRAESQEGAVHSQPQEGSGMGPVEGSEGGGDEPPEDWLEPLEDDDFEDEEDEEGRSWEQSGSREGSISGSLGGGERSIRGRGGRGGRRARARARALLEENWEDCAELGEGWKRKEVFRRSGCYMGKSDTYYMSPTGERVRSKVELAKCLSNSVDLDMFDFKSGHFHSEQRPKKRRRLPKESELSDCSPEEDHPLAEKQHMPAKRKRAKNFSDLDKSRLRQLVLSFPEAQGNGRGFRSTSNWRRAWSEICLHFNSDSDTPRTPHQLQVLWKRVCQGGGRMRGPRGQRVLATLARLCKAKEKRRRRRVQAPALDPQQPPHNGLLCSPPQAPPAPPSDQPDTPLTTLLSIKQESSDTLVSTHEHTLLHTHASFLDQDYNPTSYIQPSATSDTEHSLSDCPAPHHARHATLLTDSSEDAQLSSQASAPETSLFACMGSSVTDGSPPPCGSLPLCSPDGHATGDSLRSEGDQRVGERRGQQCVGKRRGSQRMSLGDQLALTFHRRHMRFLQQEHELRMRVLRLELSLREQERNLLAAHAATLANQHMPQAPTANQHTPQGQVANHPAPQAEATNRHTPQAQTTNEHMPQAQTPKHQPPQAQTANDHTPQAQTANDHTPQAQTANDHTPQAQTGNDHTPQPQAANDHTPQPQTANDHTPQDQAANDPTPQAQTANDPTPQAQAANDPTPQAQAANDHMPQAQTANDHTPPAQTANERTPQDQTANDHTPQDQIAQIVGHQTLQDQTANHHTHDKTADHQGPQTQTANHQPLQEGRSNGHVLQAEMANHQTPHDHLSNYHELQDQSANHHELEPQMGNGLFDLATTTPPCLSPARLAPPPGRFRRRLTADAVLTLITCTQALPPRPPRPSRLKRHGNRKAAGSKSHASTSSNTRSSK